MRVTGQQAEYHFYECLRFLVVGKPLDILLHDGDTVLHRVAVAVGLIIPYGDTLVTRGIGKGVCTLAVFFQLQYFRLHIDDAAKVVQYRQFRFLDPLAEVMEQWDRPLDGFVHQFLIGLAITFGLFLVLL